MPCFAFSTQILTSPLSWLHLPLGAVCMAGMTFIVGLCVLEDEAVGTLQAIGTLFHTVWTILEIEAIYTMFWTLRKVKARLGLFVSQVSCVRPTLLTLHYI